MIKSLSTLIRRDVTPARGGYEIDYDAPSWWARVIPRPTRIVFIGAEVAVEFRAMGANYRWRARRDRPDRLNLAGWICWGREHDLWIRDTGPEDFA